MSNIKITCSVNAGLSVACDDFKLLVDPFPAIPAGGFSALSEEMLKDAFACGAFREPDLIFITHDHPDHYDARTMAQYLNRWSEAKIVMPDCPFFGGVSLAGECSMTCGNASLRFFPLYHQDEKYADVAHYGLLCNINGRTLLFTGDGIVADEALKTVLSDISVDIAVLPFPWVTLRRGIAFIDHVISPQHIVINHLPLPQDDTYNYGKMAKRYCHSVSCTPDLRIMDQFLKTEIL